MMPALLLLAQTARLWSLENILLLVVAGLVGSGFLLAIVVLTGWGYWKRTIAPLIISEVADWHTKEDQKNKRLKEIDDKVSDWHLQPVQQEQRAKELQNMLRDPKVVDEHESRIKRIIDDQIQRKDGLISKEIESQVSDMETRLMVKLEEVAQFLKDDTSFKQQMIQRMAKLEGAIQALTHQPLTTQSTASMSAQHLPKKPGT